MKQSYNKHLFSYIHITPIVISCCILLMIFMFLNFSFGYRVYYSIKVRVLPEVFSTSETKEGNPQFLIMVVDKDKNISINSEIFNFNDISTQVRRELEMRPTNRRKVLLKASKQLKYGDVAKIIDEIKGAGASDIVLQVDDLNSL